jgi:hypothetical protein
MGMKGILYSIMAVLLTLPLISLILYYSVPKTENIDISIRASELRYLVDSIEKDLKRFLEISGKRTLISAVSYVIMNGTGLDNAELRLREMIENGTLYGEVAALVDKSNLNLWEQNITTASQKSGFNVEFRTVDINITQNSSFDVLFEVMILMNVSDGTAKMGVLRNISASVEVPIEGLEDPLFPLMTYGRVTRVIRASNFSKRTNFLVQGTNSTGSVSGYAFVKLSSQVQAGDADPSRILVTDTITGIESIASLFGGVVSESDTIIPDTFTGVAITGATNAMQIIENGTKIYLDEGTKKVWDLGNLTLDIKNGYYHPSNYSASFLDRLEGNISLSTKYKYGIETFVNLEDLTTADIDINSYASCLDYEYWGNIYGYTVRNGDYDPVFNWFKISQDSAIIYGINDLI